MEKYGGFALRDKNLMQKLTTERHHFQKVAALLKQSLVRARNKNSYWSYDGFDGMKSQLALNSLSNFKPRRGKLDIYIPQVNVVLEYDNSYFHKEKKLKL